MVGHPETLTKVRVAALWSTSMLSTIRCMAIRKDALSTAIRWTLLFASLHLLKPHFSKFDASAVTEMAGLLKRSRKVVSLIQSSRSACRSGQSHSPTI